MYVIELILAPFSPFDKMKNLWKCIFRAFTRVTFSYFPKIALNHGGAPTDTF